MQKALWQKPAIYCCLLSWKASKGGETRAPLGAFQPGLAAAAFRKPSATSTHPHCCPSPGSCSAQQAIPLPHPHLQRHAETTGNARTDPDRLNPAPGLILTACSYLATRPCVTAYKSLKSSGGRSEKVKRKPCKMQVSFTPNTFLRH